MVSSRVDKRGCGGLLDGLKMEYCKNINFGASILKYSIICDIS